MLIPNKKILGLTCTNGRFTYLRRLLSCFLNQDYNNKILLIYNNADIPIEMEPLSNVILVNNCIDTITKKPYKDVGSIHRDALGHCPSDIDYVSIMDDDDIFLPKHFSTAIHCFEKSPSYKVWQPGHYFHKYSNSDVEYRKTDNYLEGSCVLEYNFLQEVGFGVGNSLEYNLHWYLEAVNRKVIYIDGMSAGTFCCEYGQQDVVHTSSFSEENPHLNRTTLNKEIQKINNYGIGEPLTPWSKEEIDFLFSFYFDIDNYE